MPGIQMNPDSVCPSFRPPCIAARKVDTKVAYLFLKVAQKVATLKNRFKTSLKWVFSRFQKTYILDFI